LARRRARRRAAGRAGFLVLFLSHVVVLFIILPCYFPAGSHGGWRGEGGYAGGGGEAREANALNKPSPAGMRRRVMQTERKLSKREAAGDKDQML
jgi:hypothetical protein